MAGAARLALGSIAVAVIAATLGGCGSTPRTSLSPHDQARYVLALSNHFWLVTQGLDQQAETALNNDARARCPALAVASSATRSHQVAVGEFFYFVGELKGMQIAYPPYKRFVTQFADLHPTAPPLKRLLAADEDTLSLSKRARDAHVDVCAGFREVAAHRWDSGRALAIGRAMYDSVGIDDKALGDAETRRSNELTTLQRLGLDSNEALQLEASIGFG